MNIFYLGAVISGRILNLLCLLILSHILKAGDFGLYALAATNAQASYLLIGAWIPNYTWKKISTCAEEGRSRVYSEVASLVIGTIFVGLAILLGSISAIEEDYRLLALAIFVWSTLILLFDTALVILNASNRPGDYAKLSFLRGVLLVALSVGLATTAFEAWGAIAGSMLATILGVAAYPKIWEAWRGIEFTHPVPTEFIHSLRFGMASVLALNIYLIVNAIIRNLLVAMMGPSEAGFASLAADLFFAPVALFSTAISLSKIPQLYREALGDEGEASSHDREFFLANVAAVAAYVVGGAFVAGPLAQMVLNPDTAQGIVAIAPLSAIQGGCFALISTLTTIALTKGATVYAVVVSIASIITTTLALFLASTYNSLYHYSFFVTINLSIIAILILATSKFTLNLQIPMIEIVKISISAGVMAAVVLGIGTANALMTLLSIAIGGLTFVGVGVAMSSQSVTFLLRMSRR